MSDKKMSWTPFRRPTPRDPNYDRELSFHIDQLTQAGIAQGLSPEEARRRLPGPESAGERFLLAAEAPMELSGHLVDFVDGRLVAVN